MDLKLNQRLNNDCFKLFLLRIKFVVTKNQVLNALKKCYDPEIPVDIVNLGLIYEVKIGNGNVKIKMTLTNPFCPVLDALIFQIKENVKKIKGVKDVDVEITFDPPWTPDKMSKEAKRKLGLI